MLLKFQLQTQRQGLYDITSKVKEALAQSGVVSGLCVVYCSHTTAGITINENADPDVCRDILLGLDKAYPHRAEFLHSEGNSAAHLKASAMGASASLIIEEAKLVLGIWQGIYFCEFDGPRSRHYYVKIQ